MGPNVCKLCPFYPQTMSQLENIPSSSLADGVLSQEIGNTITGFSIDYLAYI